MKIFLTFFTNFYTKESIAQIQDNLLNYYA